MKLYHSICENRDFRRLYTRGKSVVGRTLVTYAGRNREGCVRIGITTGKKVGNAVLRNRSRRIIREAFRTLAPRIKKGTDLIFVARAKTAYIKSTELLPEMEKQLRKIGVINFEKEG